MQARNVFLCSFHYIGYDRCKAGETGFVLFIEAGKNRAVDIEDAEQTSVRKQNREDDLRIGGQIAGDMVAAAMNILHPLDGQRLCGGSADAVPDGDLRHRGLALKRAEDQLLVPVQVKSRPVDFRQEQHKQRGRVGKDGRLVGGLPCDAQELFVQIGVQIFLLRKSLIFDVHGVSFLTTVQPCRLRCDKSRRER